MIHFIADKYHKHNLFHGDIKPENIFFNDKYSPADDRDFRYTSDISSILHLGKGNQKEVDKFIVTCFTENFASEEHVEAVKNQTPLSKEQLMKEDKH